MENSLPKGWSESQLINLLETLESGSRPKGGVRGITSGIPSIGGEHLNDEGGFDFSNIKYVPETFAHGMTKGKISIGDILIVKDGATTGKTSYVSEDFPHKTAFVNEHVFICRANQELDSKYLYWYLRSKEGNERVMDNFKGSAQGGINQSFASNTLVPVAPLPEQQRIVAKLDELMAKIERSRARLERIPKILKRFRQSVLSAAVSGKLTEDWRERNGINEEWRELEFGDCIIELRNGLGKKPNINPPGIPILRIGALRPASIDFTDIRYYNANENNIEMYFLKENDLLFTRYNGSIEFLGVCGVVKGIKNNYVYPDKLIRVRTDYDKLLPGYCEIYFQSERARDEILKYAKSSAGQNGISGGDLKRIIINCPPKEEQKEIIRLVERLFLVSKKIELRYNKAKAQLDKLPQSLLAKAFRGELVPQDEKDEPASMLLERINCEKSNIQKSTPSRRRSANVKLNKSLSITAES